ncbi:MAG: hypothetical protein JSV84_09380 [Gemmatimonadota bacterium]|nr:MAG: hypothetical protein JSV84_09380 [Gemmatimonadota bacterium]
MRLIIVVILLVLEVVSLVLRFPSLLDFLGSVYFYEKGKDEKKSNSNPEIEGVREERDPTVFAPDVLVPPAFKFTEAETQDFG